MQNLGIPTESRNNSSSPVAVQQEPAKSGLENGEHGTVSYYTLCHSSAVPCASGQCACLFSAKDDTKLCTGVQSVRYNTLLRHLYDVVLLKGHFTHLCEPSPKNFSLGVILVLVERLKSGPRPLHQGPRSNRTLSMKCCLGGINFLGNLLGPIQKNNRHGLQMQSIGLSQAQC